MNDSTSTAAMPALQEKVGLRAPLVFSAVILVGFGFLYSLAGAGLGRVLFPTQAQGSLVMEGDRVVGSALVAQPFADARYLMPRPSAAGYDPMAAAGSNQARSNPDFQKRVAETIAAVAAREHVAPAEVPFDLATQSGSGMDPHISPAAARVQVARVAQVRGLAPEVVQGVVDANTERPQFGLLGQPRVPVLRVNLALDALAHGDRAQ